MADLKNPAIIWTKGVLFLVIGLSAAVLIVLRAPSLTVAVLLCIAIWGFCRFYYFAFYVIEQYVDANYRFSGLWSFVCYAVGERRKRRGRSSDSRCCCEPRRDRRGRRGMIGLIQ